MLCFEKNIIVPHSFVKVEEPTMKVICVTSYSHVICHTIYKFENQLFSLISQANNCL